VNTHQKIAISSGFIFIGFIIIIALLDFNNVIIALGLLAVIATISGLVKVLLLGEKRKEVQKELAEFQESQEKLKPKKPPKQKRYKYYCPKCLNQSDTYSKACPKCEGGELMKAK
jgi:hypothetical protein